MSSQFQRILAGVTLVAVLILPVASGFAQLSQAWTWCVNKDKLFAPDLQIHGCTSTIQSGRESQMNLGVAFNNRGIAYSDKKEYNRAIQDYDQAIMLNPNDAVVYTNRAIAKRNLKDYDSALADLNVALRLDPRQASIYVFRGLIWQYQKENLNRAIEDYSSAIDIEPEFPGAYTNRGLAHEKKDQFTLARADFKKALSLPRGKYRDDKWAHDTARERLKEIGE